ncbi:hypothetical protein EST38_g7297 [Candolleomyces aberdarensis]|uniref:Uncharacterized protein n=1 Tax=Candolleomyces aberdarensis TaxID=2316362 RepID=A0A4Q2DFH9_9AGAR|nr:hypothetical protein EST38_g7297 [Candolleomyces aberdarensis]
MVPRAHRVTVTEHYALLHQFRTEDEPNRVVIWNFSSGQFVFWSLLETKLARRSVSVTPVSAVSISDPSFQLVIAGDCLLGFTSEGILAWDLRDFKAERSTNALVAKEVQPDFAIDYHDYNQRECAPYLFALNSLPISPLDTDSEFCYEVIAKTDDSSRDYAVNRYILSPRAADELDITYLSQRIISLPGPFHETENPVHTLFETYPSFSTALYHPDKYFKLLISPVVARCDSEWHHISLKAPMHEVTTGYSVCPLTGRMIYICDGPHEDNFRKIHLVDFSGN